MSDDLPDNDCDPSNQKFADLIGAIGMIGMIIALILMAAGY